MPYVQENGLIYHPCIEPIAKRYADLDKRVRSGRIDVSTAVGDWAWVVKDNTLGVAKLASAIATDADDAEMSVPFVVTTLQEDRDGDVVVPLGCQLHNFKHNPVCFFGHQQTPLPIAKCKSPDGRVTVFPEENLVRAVMYFDQEDEFAVKVYKKIKSGFLNATSIAFVPIEAYRRDREEEKGILNRAHPHSDGMTPPGWVFKQYDLTEISVVGVPSNSGAIRDWLDQDKELTVAQRKIIQPYAAKSLGRSFSGWCPPGYMCDKGLCVPEKSVEKALGEIGLWKYNTTTGYWVLARMCAEDQAQQWLAGWQQDEPKASFKLSRNKPSGAPKSIKQVEPDDDDEEEDGDDEVFTKKSCASCKNGKACGCKKQVKKGLLLFKATVEVKNREDVSWLIVAANKDDADRLARQQAKKKTGGTVLVGLRYVGPAPDGSSVGDNSEKSFGVKKDVEPTGAEMTSRSLQTDRWLQVVNFILRQTTQRDHSQFPADVDAIRASGANPRQGAAAIAMTARPKYDSPYKKGRMKKDANVLNDAVRQAMAAGFHQIQSGSGDWEELSGWVRKPKQGWDWETAELRGDKIVATDADHTTTASGQIHRFEWRLRKRLSAGKRKFLRAVKQPRSKVQKSTTDYEDGKAVGEDDAASDLGKNKPYRDMLQQNLPGAYRDRGEDFSRGWKRGYQVYLQLHRPDGKRKQLLESSGTAGGYTVPVENNIDSTSTPGDIVCQQCAGTGNCPACEGVGEYESKACEACDGAGNCSACQGVGVMEKDKKPKSKKLVKKGIPEEDLKRQLQYYVGIGGVGRAPQSFLDQVDAWLVSSKNPIGEMAGSSQSRAEALVRQLGIKSQKGNNMSARKIAAPKGFARKAAKAKAPKRRKSVEDDDVVERDLENEGNPEELKGEDDPNPEPFNPKPSALEAAKAYSHIKELGDYFGSGGAGDLENMDNKGMQESLKELLDDHIPKMMDHVKSALAEHHGTDDEQLEKMCKSIEDMGAATTEDDVEKDDSFETGEDNLVDAGDMPPEVEESVDEMGEAVTEDDVDKSEVGSEEWAGEEAGEPEHKDPDTEEILERYQHPKSHKWLTRKVGVARRAKDGRVYIVRKSEKSSSPNESTQCPWGLTWQIRGGKSGRKWFSTEQEREKFADKLSENNDVNFSFADPDHKDLTDEGNPAELKSECPQCMGPMGSAMKFCPGCGTAKSVDDVEGTEDVVHRDLTDEGNSEELKAQTCPACDGSSFDTTSDGILVCTNCGERAPGKSLKSEQYTPDKDFTDDGNPEELKGTDDEKPEERKAKGKRVSTAVERAFNDMQRGNLALKKTMQRLGLPLNGVH